jgi:hypothetical protein
MQRICAIHDEALADMVIACQKKNWVMFLLVFEGSLSLLSAAENYLRYINAIAKGSKRWHRLHWPLAIQFPLVP